MATYVFLDKDNKLSKLNTLNNLSISSNSNTNLHRLSIKDKNLTHNINLNVSNTNITNDVNLILPSVDGTLALTTNVPNVTTAFNFGTEVSNKTVSIGKDTGINSNININGNNINLNNKTIIHGHILPNLNAQYDLGSAEKKIRHLFLSDNSLWIGDKHKIDISGEQISFRKRNINKAPERIKGTLATSGVDPISSVNTHLGKSYTAISQVKLEDWINLAHKLNISDPENIFNHTDDYAESKNLTSISNDGKVEIASGAITTAHINTDALGDGLVKDGTKIKIKDGSVTNDMLVGSINNKLNTITSDNKINISSINIKGGTDIDTLSDADLLIVDDGATGTNRKTPLSKVITYLNSNVSSLSSLTTVGTLTNITVTGATSLATNSGNVGIGVTSPTEKLEVSGNTKIIGTLGVSGASTLASATINGELKADGGINCDNNKFKVENDTGNVGIGVTSPTEKLEVSGNTKITGTLGVSGASTLASATVNGNTVLGGNISPNTAPHSVVCYKKDTGATSVSLYGVGNSSVYQEQAPLAVYRHLPTNYVINRTDNGNQYPHINIITDIDNGLNKTHLGGTIQFTTQTRTSSAGHGQAYACIYGGREGAYEAYNGEFIFYTSQGNRGDTGGETNLKPRMIIRNSGVNILNSLTVSGASTLASATINSALSVNGTATFANSINCNSITGNAATATKLQTARNIAGQSFDGHADISIASSNLSDSNNLVTIASNQTITGTKTFENPINGSITGNAVTATKLQTARNIANQSFDGSADISIASSNLSDGNNLVTIASNQTITGTKTFTGNVGIGTTASTEELEVLGNTKITGTLNAGASTLASAIISGALSVNGTATFANSINGTATFTNPINGDITGNAGTATKLNKLSNGTIFLNNLGQYSDNNWHFLWFNTGAGAEYTPGPNESTTNVSAGWFNAVATGTNQPSGRRGYFFKHDTNGSDMSINNPYGYTPGYGSQIQLSYRNIIKFKFLSSGKFEHTGGAIDPGTSWNVSLSDDRLKVNEEELPVVTPLIKQLKPQKYKKYILDRLYSKENPTSFKERLGENIDEFGLIAQEVYTIPEFRLLVLPPSDSDMDKIKNTVIYTDLHEPDNYYENYGWGTKEPASINYMGFIPILIKGFNEQQIEIETLKTQKQEQQIEIETLKTQKQEQQIKIETLKTEIENINNLLRKNNIT